MSSIVPQRDEQVGFRSRGFSQHDLMRFEPGNLVLRDASAHDDGTLRQRGLARAAQFDWQTTAEQTWQVYQATGNARR